MAPQAMSRCAALAAAQQPGARAPTARGAPAAPLARRTPAARRLPARAFAAAAAAAAAAPPPPLPRQRGAWRPAAVPSSPPRGRRPGASRHSRGSAVVVSAAASGFAPAAAVASLVHAAGFTSLLQALASLLGLAMGAGSLLLYSPIVLRLARTRSADGMAASTWALQLFGFTAVCIYNTSKGFPIAAYAETLSFAVQARTRARESERGRERNSGWRGRCESARRPHAAFQRFIHFASFAFDRSMRADDTRTLAPFPDPRGAERRHPAAGGAPAAAAAHVAVRRGRGCVRGAARGRRGGAA
jgi:hypothetical protein